MIATRWFLVRPAADPSPVALVVEEVGDPRRRGITTEVLSREEARFKLPILRDFLEQRILRADTTPQQNYDPAEGA